MPAPELLLEWERVCREQRRAVLIDRAEIPGLWGLRSVWYVYAYPSGQVHGPYKGPHRAFCTARRLLCPSARPWRHSLPQWVWDPRSIWDAVDNDEEDEGQGV